MPSARGQLALRVMVDVSVFSDCAYVVVVGVTVAVAIVIVDVAAVNLHDLVRRHETGSK